MVTPKGKRIAVVLADAELRRVLCDILEAEGFDVSSWNALAGLPRGWRGDLIVIGTRAVERADDLKRHVPELRSRYNARIVIATTKGANDPAVVAANADGVLLMPFDIEDALRIVRATLAARP